MERNTKQRELIFNYLKNNKNHPKAEQIYNELKGKLPNLSLATVYRNLKLFHKENKLLSLNSSDGKTCFDADTSNHFHFECNKCKKIYDIPYIEVSENVIKEVEKIGSIDSNMLLFYGVCNNCINK